jgi:hypothetical protein
MLQTMHRTQRHFPEPMVSNRHISLEHYSPEVRPRSRSAGTKTAPSICQLNLRLSCTSHFKATRHSGFWLSSPLVKVIGSNVHFFTLIISWISQATKLYRTSGETHVTESKFSASESPPRPPAISMTSCAASAPMIRLDVCSQMLCVSTKETPRNWDTGCRS